MKDFPIQDEFQELTVEQRAEICKDTLSCDTVNQVLRIFPKSTIAIFGMRIAENGTEKLDN